MASGLQHRVACTRPPLLKYLKQSNDSCAPAKSPSKCAKRWHFVWRRRTFRPRRARCVRAPVTGTIDTTLKKHVRKRVKSHTVYKRC
eukprot:3689682-Pyramimonas_sp.AAC.1